MIRRWANILRRSNKPVLLVVNKLDNPNDTNAMWEFMQLGLGEPWPVSALHGTGTGDLLDEVVQRFPEPTEEEHDELDAINVAIIGRPNAASLRSPTSSPIMIVRSFRM